MEIKGVIKDDKLFQIYHRISIIRNLCSLRIESKLRLSKQIKAAFKLFIDFSLMHYQHGKNAFLLRYHKLTPGSTVADEQSVLCVRELGFPASPPCRNKHWTSATVKEEITYLDCQIPAPFTVLVVIISSTVKGLVFVHWSVTDQTTLVSYASSLPLWQCKSFGSPLCSRQK